MSSVNQKKTSPRPMGQIIPQQSPNAQTRVINHGTVQVVSPVNAPQATNPQPRPTVYMGNLEGVQTVANQAAIASINAELEALNAEEEALKARRLRIAELEAEKIATEARNAEEVRQMEINNLLPEFITARQKWQDAQNVLLEDLRRLMEDFVYHVQPAHKIAAKLERDLLRLGSRQTLLSCPHTGADWLAVQLRGDLYTTSRAIGHKAAEIMAEEAGWDK